MGLTDTDRAALRRMKSDFHMDARVIVPDLLPRLHQVLLPDDMSRVEHRGNTVGWASAANQMLDIYEARANNLNPLVAALDNVNLGKMADKLRTVAAIKIELITLDDDEQGSKPSSVDGQFSGDVRPEAVKDSDSCDAQMPELPSRLRPRCHLSPGPSTSGETPPGNQQNQETEISDIRLRTVSPASTATSGCGDKDNTENQTPTTQRAEDDPASGSRGQNSDVRTTTPSGGGYKDKTQISGNHRRYKTRKNYREKDIPSSDSESGEEQLGSDYEPSDDEVDSDNEPESDQEKSTNNKTHLAHRQQQPHKLKNKKRKFQKLYKCSVSECSYETQWKENLKPHHRHHHSNEKPFECSMCDHRTADKKSMTTHEQSFKGELFQCGWTPCPQRFCTTWSRTSHEQLVHGSKTEKHFVCEDCNSSFKLRANYNRHMLSAAHSEPLHECAKCGQRFSRGSNRDTHQKQCKCANA